MADSWKINLIYGHLSILPPNDEKQLQFTRSIMLNK